MDSFYALVGGQAFVLVVLAIGVRVWPHTHGGSLSDAAWSFRSVLRRTTSARLVDTLKLPA